jgi:hypothetical protein
MLDFQGRKTSGKAFVPHESKEGKFNLGGPRVDPAPVSGLADDSHFRSQVGLSGFDQVKLLFLPDYKVAS